MLYLYVFNLLRREQTRIFVLSMTMRRVTEDNMQTWLKVLCGNEHLKGTTRSGMFPILSIGRLSFASFFESWFVKSILLTKKQFFSVSAHYYFEPMEKQSDQRTGRKNSCPVPWFCALCYCVEVYSKSLLEYERSRTNYSRTLLIHPKTIGLSSGCVGVRKHKII